MNPVTPDTVNMEKTYFLNDLIGTRVFLHGKKIGFLADVVVRENGNLPVVSYLFVGRLFGNKPLLIPWENIRSLTAKEIVVRIDDVSRFEGEPGDSFIKLKDHILDKKVLDTEDREVEVVYDVRLVAGNNKLFVSDVDISPIALFRRVGLGGVEKFLHRTPEGEKLIPWKYIQHVPMPLGRFRGNVKLRVLKEKLAQIHPVDLADILEELDATQRVAVFEELDTHKASATLEEIDPKSQRELISALKKEKIVQMLTHMTSGQAADILSVLPYAEAKDLLQLLGEIHRRKIKAIMEKQVELAVNFSTTRFLKFPPTMNVGEVRRNYHEIARGKRIIMYIYIVNEHDKLLGVVDVKDLLLADENKTLMNIRTPKIISLHLKSSLREALQLFDRYYYRALPITDSRGKIIGVVPYRDLRKFRYQLL